MKKTLKILLTSVLLLNLFTLTTFAGTENTVKPANNLKHSVKYVYSSDSNNFTLFRSNKNNSIAYGKCEIEPVEKRYLKVRCKTRAVEKVDEIGYTIIYQKYKNGEWENIDSLKRSISNSDSIEHSHTKRVESGYNYRVKCTYFVVQNGQKNTLESTSDSVKVN